MSFVSYGFRFYNFRSNYAVLVFYYSNQSCLSCYCLNNLTNLDLLKVLSLKSINEELFGYDQLVQHMSVCANYQTCITVLVPTLLLNLKLIRANNPT